MEKSVSSLKILNIILCVIILVIFVIGTRSVKANEINSSNDEVLPSILYKIGIKYQPLIKQIKEETKFDQNNILKNIDYYINKNIETIKFFANIFGYDIKDIIEDLKQKEKLNNRFYINNIGLLRNKDNELKEFKSFEYGLIEYFYDLTKNNNIKRNKEYIPYLKDADYIEKLIIYYCTIYDNTDVHTLLSIGAAESGYYKVKYMLKRNNVYGGMTSNGLIKHNNIELGTLTYVRMMSRNYYEKGLDTINEIGRVYCPVFIDGIKTASPHWIKLVKTAKKKYSKYNYEITINDILKKVQES